MDENENLIKKIMPHDENLENSLIGELLLDKDRISEVSEILQPEDFYEKRLGTIFGILCKLVNEGSSTDILTVQNRLKASDIAEEYTSLEYLTGLASMVPTGSVAKDHARQIKDKSMLRQFIRSAENAVNECYSGKEEVPKIFAEAEKNMFEVFQRANSGKEIVSIDQIVLESIEKINTASKNNGAVTGIPTGFIDLDYMTAGMQPSDLVLIAARPSMGKTAFVLNIAEYMGITKDYATAIFSLEMSREQLVNRFLSMVSGVSAQNIRTGHLDSQEWSSLMEAARRVAESKIIIDDTPSISLGEFRSKCRRLKLEKDIKCVIVDYLQLMTTGRRKDESNQQAISEISRTLKAVAREIKCPVLALSQLSREVEKRDDKRPQLSDLRDSGAIEQDADVVMFIYRDEYYKKQASEHPGEAEIIIGKQRNGPVGSVTLKWIGEQTRFKNILKS